MTLLYNFQQKKAIGLQNNGTRSVLLLLKVLSHNGLIQKH